MRKTWTPHRANNLSSAKPFSIVFGLLLISSASAIVSAPAKRLPMTFNLNEIKNFNAVAWGPIAKERDKTYRLALKDQEAWLRVPRWWGKDR